MLSRNVIFLTLVVIFGIVPGEASAHAAIVSSQPAAGQRVGNAPSFVLVRFTEPINPRLSRARVMDPTGRVFEGVAARDEGLRVPLSTDAPGVYQVEWTTVSILDGHTLRGSYYFGVRTDVAQGALEGTLAEPQRTDLLLSVARALEYAALLVALGMALLTFLAGRAPQLTWVRFRLDIPLAVALASGLGVFLGETYTAAGSLTPSAIGAYLLNGLPGAARMLRLVDEAAALMLALPAPRVAALPLIAAVIALSAAGHAAAVRPPWAGISVDAVHLVSAGAWLGSILALATLRPPGGWRSSEARALLSRFSPIALVAFLVTISTGLLRSVQELSGISDLVSSSYGQILSLKVLGVLAMVALSIAAWRGRFVPRFEPVIATLVIGAAALLASYPLPPGRAGEAEAAREGPLAAAQALPREGDLVLGERAGDTLLGLSIRPGQPGPNEIHMYVVPAAGQAAADKLPVQLTLEGRAVEVRDCGGTCRVANVELRGGERGELRVGFDPVARAGIDIPSLPAGDGRALLDTMQQRMRQLHTLRIVETLGPATPPVTATYTMQAPDRLESVIVGGSQMTWIGETRYLRERQTDEWQIENAGFALPVPSYVWEPPSVNELRTPRVIGRERVDGVNTQVVSFFGQAGPLPVWFRAWIDAGGLVHRAEMRAEAHFMDHRYDDFDAALTVEAPSLAPAP